MQEGQIVIVIEKKGRGYYKSVQLATVMKVVNAHRVVLYDGRVFTCPDPGEPKFFYNYDLRYKTFMRAPFSWETFADYVQIRGMA
jgi:hypothetical protein